MKTYFWEFFGPDATPTARHFERHLLQFLVAHGLVMLESGVISGPGQALVFCSADSEAGEAMAGALRPVQSAEGGLPEELRTVFDGGSTEAPA